MGKGYKLFGEIIKGILATVAVGLIAIIGVSLYLSSETNDALEADARIEKAVSVEQLLPMTRSKNSHIARLAVARVGELGGSAARNYLQDRWDEFKESEALQGQKNNTGIGTAIASSALRAGIQDIEIESYLLNVSSSKWDVNVQVVTGLRVLGTVDAIDRLADFVSDEKDIRVGRMALEAIYKLSQNGAAQVHADYVLRETLKRLPDDYSPVLEIGLARLQDQVKADIEEAEY